MASDHTKALKYYKEHQEELVAKYNGKTLIFRDDEILDVKNSIEEAYNYALEKYGIGDFSLQEVAPGEGSYTAYIATPGVLV
jgi:hypothetical protein